VDESKMFDHFSMVEIVYRVELHEIA
jgi:hypothetical protein